MTTELNVTLMIIILCWILLTAADAIVCGLLKLLLAIPFKRAFLWGLLSLLLPPIVIAYGAAIERNCLRVKEVTISHLRYSCPFILRKGKISSKGVRKDKQSDARHDSLHRRSDHPLT